jgi:hypothetical protein
MDGLCTAHSIQVAGRVLSEADEFLADGCERLRQTVRTELIFWAILTAL